MNTYYIYTCQLESEIYITHTRYLQKKTKPLAMITFPLNTMSVLFSRIDTSPTLKHQCLVSQWIIIII